MDDIIDEKKRQSSFKIRKEITFYLFYFRYVDIYYFSVIRFYHNCSQHSFFNIELVK